MKLYDNITRILGRKPAPSDRFYKSDDDLPCEIVQRSERESIVRSFAIYKGQAPWLSENKKGLSLASDIVSEISRLTVTEFSTSFGNEKKDKAMESYLSSFLSKMRSNVEYACATGGVIFKPCCDGKTITVKTVLPFDFLPLGTDGNGVINECAFLEKAKVGNENYLKVETHTCSDGVYTITNRAFRYENGRIGRACPLSTVKKWENISPKTEMTGLRGPLFSYFSMPQGKSNSYSPLGVPIFRRAEELIKEADLQFGRLLWEFEGGELAIDASEDAFRIGKDGRPRLPDGKERLYRTNALDACSSSSELLKIFAPELRDKSLINGLNRIVMFIEDACGIARGTFSDPSEVAKTATEVRSMRQRTYSTVTSIQDSLRHSLNELFRAVNDLAHLYGLWEGEVDAEINFGDGVLTDSESDRSEQREDVKYGIITPEEFREKWYK